MTLREVKEKIIKLDPYDVVGLDMDDFDPYLVLNLPDEIINDIGTLSTWDQDNYEEWSCELLSKLTRYGGGMWKV
jgi:hypothetical protein